MSQYYQYALNLLARLVEIENSIGYSTLMDYLQDFKKTNDSIRLSDRTGLKYASFDNMESVFNRAERYLKKEGTFNEQFDFSRFWELPEIAEERRIDFFTKDTVVENNCNLFGKSESHIGLSVDAAFSSNDFTVSPDANIAYVRTPNLSRVDIFLDSITIEEFMDMMYDGVKENLDLLQYQGKVSLMIYYQINKHEFVKKVSEFTEMKILSTKFRDFSDNDGFQQREAYLELLTKLTRLFNAMNPYVENPNADVNVNVNGNVDYDIDVGDDEASYRKKLLLAGAIEANEEFNIYIVGFTIKSYWNNLGHESENLEEVRS